MAEGKRMKTALFAELGAFIREHTEELASVIETEFPRQYPRSRSNAFQASAIYEWALVFNQSFAEMVETGEFDLFIYQDNIGDAVEDPNDSELTLFSTFVSMMLFMGRCIAPLIYKHTYSSGKHTRQLLSALEERIQGIIRHNCTVYADSISQPNVIVRQWNLLAMVREGAIREDSLAAQFMEPEQLKRFSRRDSDTFASPAGNSLTAREKTVLNLVVDGSTNAEIAKLLGISKNTVNNHVAHIFDKYNVNSRAELIAKVLR